MRLGIIIGGLIAAVLLGSAPAIAQAPKTRLHLQKSFMSVPRQPAAVRIATIGHRVRTLIPGAKLLRVVRLSNSRFLVIFKKDGKVEKLIIAG